MFPDAGFLYVVNPRRYIKLKNNISFPDQNFYFCQNFFFVRRMEIQSETGCIGSGGLCGYQQEKIINLRPISAGHLGIINFL